MTTKGADFWDEVEALFAAVVVKPQTEQREELQKLCGDRDDLRTEVESLLAAHYDAGTFLTGGNGTLASSAQDARIGMQVGSFKLVERIGSGGMGDVFRAERTGGDFDQQVAVKLIATRVSSDDAVRRFRIERRVLANLQHPNIVALLDGGVTAAAQPYLAMECVDGEPITEFCRRSDSTLEERLKLFQQLCSAVDFAHRHLVVHRDLKPANVLVTTERVVKVLDFGIAKLLDDDEAAGMETAPLMTPLTPNYTSPEQLRGDRVTTASDVYALGVILYELIAGTRPYDTSGKPLDEILDLIVSREPPPPSAHKKVSRDLDMIVMRSMAKEPGRRYASAAELSQDIERFLAGAPIIAGGTSMIYLLRKAAARHRTAVTIASISIVILVAALVMAIDSARIAARERQRALQRFHDVRELAGALIFKIHDEVAPLPGSTPVRRTVVAEGLKFLEKLEDDARNDPALQLELARAYIRIGDVQGKVSAANLGDRDGARRSYGRAVSLASAARLSPSVIDGAMPVLIDAHLSISETLDAESAMRSIRAGHRLAAEWYARNQNDTKAAESFARATFFLAVKTGDAEALRLWTEADRLYKQLLATEPGNVMRMRNVALTQKYLADYYDRMENPEKSLEHARNALALDRNRLERNPSAGSVLLDVAIDLGIVGRAANMHGRFEEAIDAFEESLRIREKVAAADPSDVYAHSRVAFAHAALANAYADRGHAAAARRHAATSLDMFRSHDNAKILADRGLAFAALAKAAQSEGHSAEACGWFEKARAAYASIDPLHLRAYRQVTVPAEKALEACGKRGASAGSY